MIQRNRISSEDTNENKNYDSIVSFNYRPQANYNIVEMPEISATD